jgi:tripartite-type tricarboxylate transporter receptor subunit TctC
VTSIQSRDIFQRPLRTPVLLNYLGFLKKRLTAKDGLPRKAAYRKRRPTLKESAMKTIPLLTLSLLAALAVSAMPNAQAQTYPTRPIKVIVDGPAGGINDIWTRRYTQRLSESFQQPVVVENRPGASGSIAAETLAKSPADGYTLMYGGMNPMVAFPGTGGTVRYDPIKDFSGSALGTMGYPMFVASAASGIKTLPELIQLAKSKPEEMTCGTSGQAGVQHFACVMIARALGINLRPVHYKGGGAALLDAASGQITVSVGYTAETEQMVASGKLIALASMAPNRLPRFPNAPSFAEAGYAGLEIPSFAGFFFPAGTPPAIVERFNAEAVKTMARPDMGEFVKQAGGFYVPMKSGEFSEFVAKELTKWKRMSQENGIRSEQ